MTRAAPTGSETIEPRATGKGPGNFPQSYRFTAADSAAPCQQSERKNKIIKK
jgi:hypothetical protein